MTNEKKKLFGLIGALVVLIVVAFFIINSLTPKPAPPAASEEATDVEHTEDDGHIHDEAPIKEVVYDENPDTNVEISKLILSPPVIINNAFSNTSSTDFKGSLNDERLYVMGAKGQFYYYNQETKETFTYENLVREAAVSEQTGDVVFTREIEGSNGKVGVYKALKTYPDRVLIHETTTDFLMEEVAFFKDTIIMNFFNQSTRASSVVVKPLSTDALNGVGKALASSLNGYQMNYSSNGDRLFAYDTQKNAVVELTSGSPVVYHQFTEPVNGVVTEVLNGNVLLSYNRLSDFAGFTYYNKKKIFDQSFAQMQFYDDDFAFVSDNEQSYLLDILVQDLSPLTQFANSLSVTPNSLYFTNTVGEIQKIGIKKSAE